MSRIPSDHLRTEIDKLLAFSAEHKRGFLETVELQIGLKNYDIKKDKRFAGSLELPVCPRPNLSVCILGDAAHCDLASKLGLPFMTVDNLRSLNKDQKVIKRLAKKYAAFLASESVLRILPSICGAGFSKAGKFPTLLKGDEDMMAKVNSLRATVKFQLKKSLSLNVAVGNIGMNREELARNIQLAVNFLVSLLKKQWTNMNVIYIKSTMGPSYRLF
ncbi:hypothetical protein RCL1_006745 [Eukaryota sp. TZLM3-RCL]